MVKNFNIKILPLIFLILVNFYSAKIKAAEHCKEAKSAGYIEINKKSEVFENFSKRKGLIKRSLNKLKEKVKGINRVITYKAKRFFSKRNAKKDKMRSSFKDRKRNLFNILVFTAAFLLITGLLTFLYFSSVISYTFFLISLIIIGISTIVISLIYFSGRYIIKPHYRS